MSEITYKLMKATDVEEYASDLKLMLQKTLEDNIEQKFPSTLAEEYVTKMPGYIDDGSAIIIGAFDEKKIVGFLWGYEVHVFDERRVHNAENHVLAEYRGKGIAKEMLEHLEEEAKKRGICILEAMCTASNQGAYNYHVKNGYKVERIKFKKVLVNSFSDNEE